MTAGRSSRLVVAWAAAAVLVFRWAPAAAAGELRVQVVDDGSKAARRLARRVLLDRGLVAAQGREADVAWVIGDVPAQRYEELLERVRAGRGLVIVPGRRDPALLRAVGLAVRGTAKGRTSIGALARATAVLREEVVWSSAPQAGRRWKLAERSGMQPIVTERPAGAAVLLEGRLGRGRIYVFSLQLTGRSNRELVLWPYFNYLLYTLSELAAGQTPQSFARWPSAPVIHASALWWIALPLGVAWLITLLLFFKARSYSRRHPEIVERFLRDADRPRRSSPAGGSEAGRGGGWATVGFSRPLAGFLTLVGTLFLLFVPYYWLTNVVIPNDVQPFPQARGMWDFAWEALQMAWFLFDAGTFVAFVKYFAEYRAKDPAEALRSAQFFVWWQLLTGLVQVTFACVAAVLILPHTRYGYTSNFVMLVALSQYPGFFGVITFFFQAYQRFDYNIALDLLSDWVLRFALMIPCVLFFRRWGVAHPQYGEAFGAAVGIGVGFHLSTVITFLIGVVLYRRLGLRLLPLFMVHFDGSTAKRMLSYGLRVVAGKFLFRAAQAIDKVMISLLLLNYTEWLGLKGQIHYNLMFLFPIAYRFFETAMAALSESYSNGKLKLTQYYLVRFFQVGNLYGAIGLSLMLALGPTFVVHVMDPQWARAAHYLAIAACIGAFFAPAWLSDMLQKGSGRPGLFAIVLGAEQALRIALFYVLIPRLQFLGYYLALLLTIAIKVAGAWTVNHLVILRLRLFAWQMLAAPAAAGVINFTVWRLVASVVPLQGSVPVMALFFGASLASFPLCFFALGLAGGFDHALAEEFDRASAMTGPLRPLTRMLYYAARAGWRISPLHARFPVTIEPEAMAEAEQLQRQLARGE